MTPRQGSKTHLEAHPDQDLADTAFSLTTARSAFEHRAVAVATEPDELYGSLAGPRRGPPRALQRRRPRPLGSPRLAAHRPGLPARRAWAGA